MLLNKLQPQYKIRNRIMLQLSLYNKKIISSISHRPPSINVASINLLIFSNILNIVNLVNLSIL